MSHVIYFHSPLHILAIISCQQYQISCFRYAEDPHCVLKHMVLQVGTAVLQKLPLSLYGDSNSIFLQNNGAIKDVSQTHFSTFKTYLDHHRH